MSKVLTNDQAPTSPQLAVPTREERLPSSTVGCIVRSDWRSIVSTASFNSVTFCWHLPIQLAYGSTGPLGVIGDVYLHAATGAFIGAPDAAELQRRAENLAAAHGIEE